MPITELNNPEVRTYVASLSQEDLVTITAEDAIAQANETITVNLVALMFVSLAHRNRPLADYRIEELREVYLEAFCTSRTSVGNPLLAPSGHAGRKSFLIIDEG